MEVGKVCMILWSLRRNRNDKLWSNISNRIRTVTHLAINLLGNWLNARNRDQIRFSSPRMPGSCNRWRKPDPPMLKCNLDAALIQQANSTGLGFILRDASGSFVACKTLTYPGLLIVKDADRSSLSHGGHHLGRDFGVEEYYL
ncbi:hypothetical protein DITRI_Ditri10aG0008600 [Diplodiscus trichospermus]